MCTVINRNIVRDTTVSTAAVMEISPSMFEAARIDGSGEFHTFNKIVILIMKPAMAVQAIFAFVQAWNNYFLPGLILSSNEKKTHKKCCG